jgi:hypothetical protein
MSRRFATLATNSTEGIFPNFSHLRHPDLVQHDLTLRKLRHPGFRERSLRLPEPHSVVVIPAHSLVGESSVFIDCSLRVNFTPSATMDVFATLSSDDSTLTGSHSRLYMQAEDQPAPAHRSRTWKLFPHRYVFERCTQQKLRKIGAVYMALRLHYTSRHYIQLLMAGAITLSKSTC